MSKRKSEAFTQLIVGVFIVVVIALLGYFTIVVSGFDIFAGRSCAKISIVFGQVGGLKDHDNVMYRGTKVGTVERVTVTPTNLVVVADVDRNVVLRENYRITVCNLSMLGGNYLSLEEGEGRPLDLEVTLFKGETPTDWMQDVSKIAKTMNELVNRPEMREIVSNLTVVSAKSRLIVDRVDTVMARIERGEGLVGKLTIPDDALYAGLQQTISNVNEITERVNRGEGLVGRALANDDRLYANLESTVSNVNEITARVNRGEGLVGRVLAKDDRLYLGLEGAVSNVNAIASRVNRGEGFAGQLLSGDEKLINDVKQSVAAFRKACESFDMGDMKGGIQSLTENGNRLIANLNVVAEKLRNGESTLGKLATEPGMYNEVEGLIKDCRQIIDNYRDTTPIATFSSLLTGAL